MQAQALAKLQAFQQSDFEGLFRQGPLGCVGRNTSSKAVGMQNRVCRLLE